MLPKDVLFQISEHQSTTRKKLITDGHIPFVKHNIYR